MTALVLAASRKGYDDPVARLQNKSHKCLVTIDGIPMIERVLQTLIDSKCFARILVSIEDESILSGLPSTRQWLDEKSIELVSSAENLGDSLIKLVKNKDAVLPMVITTGDNALHTADLVKNFVTAFENSSAEVAIAVTDEETVLADYPGAGIGFFRFRDGGYSFCNLFGVRSAAGLKAARIFRSGGQFRKRPWRILQVFGVLTLLLYKLRLISLERSFRLIGKKLGITIEKILLPYSFGPIDVDNHNSYKICENTLKSRRVDKNT